MRTFIITQNDANQRLDKFITKNLPNLPMSLMHRYIRLKRIKLNGKKAQNSTRLALGDTLDMYINDEFFVRPPEHFDFLSAPDRLDILYEDENILLLDKKPGLLSHPDDREYSDTLISRIKKYLYSKGEFDPAQGSSFVPSLANRIDRNTGGIVIAAKNAEALRVLNEKIKLRELHKFYLCVVHGALAKKEATLRAYLYKDSDKNKVVVKNDYFEGAKDIITKYKVINEAADCSLVEVELITGRTHQIRAHFAHIGHPLLGDGKYGKGNLNKEKGYKKQFLYSYRLIFDFTTDAGILSYLNRKEFKVKDVWFKNEFPNF